MNRLLLPFLIFILSHISSAQASIGIPVEPLPESVFKAVEITQNTTQTLLAVIGAMIAYFLANGTNVYRVFTRSERGAKTVISLCVASLSLSAFILIWNQFSIVHQLTNEFLSLSDLLPEWSYEFPFLFGLAFFILSVGTLWKDKHENPQSTN